MSDRSETLPGLDPSISQTTEAIDETTPSISPSAVRGKVPVVGIGASAGGLEAIRLMLDEAPAGTGLCFIAIMHLDPNHESMMAELINRNTALDVRQARDGDGIEADHVFVIPPGHGLLLEDGIIRLHAFEEPRGLRRPIDDFFGSLARDMGDKASCVILSGTGADGTVGLRMVKEAGGLCVAQAPETARYDGMPMSAVGTGLVDFILQPQDIVPAIQKFFAHEIEESQVADATSSLANHLDDICLHLREAIGHDFSGYKQTMLMRRVERRMQVLNILKGSDYLAHLRSDPNECDALFRDVLINVTRFFRDDLPFDQLQRRALDPIIAAAGADEMVRVWVPGCSTGEEAYSLAIMLAEAKLRLGSAANIQIFATDIDEGALMVARGATYPATTLKDIPQHYHEQYFTFLGNQIQVSPAIRDMVRFSNHSVVRDPAFSRLDLISCRNLLIYLDDKAQASLIPLFHFSLKPGGFLFLGTSETIGRYDDLFVTVDQKARLFRRRDNSVAKIVSLPLSPSTGQAFRRRSKTSEPRSPLVVQPQTQASARLLERYGPAHILVDASGYVLQTSGRLGRYLEIGEGGVSSHALSLARSGLREFVARGMREAARQSKPIVQKDVKVASEFGSQSIDLIVDPLNDGTMLIVFLEREPFEANEQDHYVQFLEPRSQVLELEDELQRMRFRLRSTVEELETVNEELKSSNEEMMSMNEELQSTNEELTTVNDELKVKIDQLAVANDDLQNYLDSARLGIVVVDRDLKVRLFTAPIQNVFPLRLSDRGRALPEIENRLDDDGILRDARQAIEAGKVTDRVIEAPDGNASYQLSIRPYRRGDGEICGAIISLHDVTLISRAQDDLRRQSERLELALGVGGMGIWNFDYATCATWMDARSAELFGAHRNTRSLEGLFAKIRNDSQIEAIKRVADAEAVGSEVSLVLPVGDGSKHDRWVRTDARTVSSSDGGKILVGLVTDVTIDRDQQFAKDLLLREMNHRVKNLFAVISAMLGLIAKEAPDVPSLVRLARERINALARAHEVTQGEATLEEFNLRDLIGTVLAVAARQDAVTIDGGDVKLPTRYITPLGLILHEWATNASKYGALIDPAGKLNVSWEADEGTRLLRLRWEETLSVNLKGHEAPTPGFGSRLVTSSARQLDARLTRELKPTGLEATLELPLSSDD